MSKFLTAIVLPTGKIICHPETTDCYHDLIESAGIIDRKTVCCVEFTPPSPNQLFEPKSYELHINDDRPNWFTKKMRTRIHNLLLARVQRMIINKNKKTIIRGTWLIPEGIHVSRITGGRIVCVQGTVNWIENAAKVDLINGSARVNVIDGSAKVNAITGSAEVNLISGSAKVDWIDGSAKVNWIESLATVGVIGGSAKVSRIIGAVKVGWIGNLAKISIIANSVKVDSDARNVDTLSATKG